MVFAQFSVLVNDVRNTQCDYLVIISFGGLVANRQVTELKPSPIFPAMQYSRTLPTDYSDYQLTTVTAS